MEFVRLRQSYLGRSRGFLRRQLKQGSLPPLGQHPQPHGRAPQVQQPLLSAHAQLEGLMRVGNAVSGHCNPVQIYSREPRVGRPAS